VYTFIVLSSSSSTLSAYGSGVLDRYAKGGRGMGGRNGGGGYGFIHCCAGVDGILDCSVGMSDLASSDIRKRNIYPTSLSSTPPLHT
jgi:hypothetical protein